MGIIRTADRSLNSREVGFTLRSSGVLKRPGPAPFYVQNGSGSADIGDLYVPWPVTNSYAAGDLGILLIESSGADSTLTPPGWTHVNGSPIVDIGDATGSKLNVLWKFAASSDEDWVSGSDPGDHYVGQLYVFRGARKDVPPGRISATSTKTSASTSYTCPAVTTPYDNCLVVMVVSDPSDLATNTFVGAPTNANLTNLTELGEYHAVVGDGGGFTISAGVKESFGNTGTSTGTIGRSITNAMITFVLEPSMAVLP